MPTDEEIRFRLAEAAYDTCEGEEILCPLGRRDLIEEISEEMGVDPTDVEYQLTRMEDDGLFVRDGTTVEIAPPAVDFLRDNGKSVLLDHELQCEILGMLYEFERENPSHPHIPKEEFESELDAMEDAINQNIWYLNEQWCLELDQALNSLYVSAAITANGRDVYERQCE